jgi:glycyl-tRNA synthetase beta chain
LTNNDTLDQATDFVMGRCKAMYQDQGISTEVIQAVSARNVTNPLDYDARIKAVANFVALPEAASLAAANKRVANILTKNADAVANAQLNNALLNDDAERNLASAIAAQQTVVENALQTQDYQAILTSLAQLQHPVDAFFDNVMVMADDIAVRNNRLALLSALRKLFLTTADISVLATK